MSKKVTTYTTSAIQAAREMVKNQVEIPRVYLDALYYSQLFEFLLEQLLYLSIRHIKVRLINSGLSYNPEIRKDWNARDYLKRLETFYPKEKHSEFYNKTTVAINKRNAFIHGCFKVYFKEREIINPNTSYFYLDEKAIETARQWKIAFLIAFRETMNLLNPILETTKLSSYHEKRK